LNHGAFVVKKSNTFSQDWIIGGKGHDGLKHMIIGISDTRKRGTIVKDRIKRDTERFYVGVDINPTVGIENTYPPPIGLDGTKGYFFKIIGILFGKGVEKKIVTIIICIERNVVGWIQGFPILHHLWGKSIISPGQVNVWRNRSFDFRKKDRFGVYFVGIFIHNGNPITWIGDSLIKPTKGEKNRTPIIDRGLGFT
jgi:hypothetical protein